MKRFGIKNEVVVIIVNRDVIIYYWTFNLQVEYFSVWLELGQYMLNSKMNAYFLKSYDSLYLKNE